MRTAGRATPTRASSATASDPSRPAAFGFVQLEFGFLLGPPDGRYLVRPSADADVEAVLVLTTLGAPERRRWRGRKGREVESADAAPVPTTRVTVVRPEPFGSAAEGGAWLDAARSSGGEAELDGAFELLNRALHAWRTASGDPYAFDLAPARLLVARIGLGDGEAVAGGRFADAWELPPQGPRRARRSMEAPEERFAAVLGGRDVPLAGEDLVLRARADLDAGRRSAAEVQARAALDALRAEGLLGDLDPEAGLEDALERMEAVCRRLRMRGLRSDS